MSIHTTYQSLDSSHPSIYAKLSFISLFLLSILVPILIIVYAGIYNHANDTSNCTSSTNISFPTWLYVNGFLNLSYAIIMFIIIYLKKFRSMSNMCINTCTTTIPIYLAIIIWTMIGSLMYWRDCLHIQPITFNYIIMGTLIYNYVICLVFLIVYAV